MRPSLSVVIVSIVQVTQAAQLFTVCHDNPYEGKVCLSGGDSSAGILEVFIQGKWNTVCYDNTNHEAASAACRQLGYTKYQNLTSYHTDSGSVISGINCPVVKSSKSVTEAEIFLLRCDVGEQSSQCTDRVYIQCDKNISVYNGQVRTAHMTDEAQGIVLQIYFENDWRPICISDSDNELNIIAESACRQMGYTNINKSSFSSTINKKKSWKIEPEYNGEQSSYPCFTDYMTQSSGYTSVDDCTGDNENVYELTCQFINSNQVMLSSGNQRICEYSSASTDVPLDVVIGVSSLLSAIIVGLAILLLCLCCCPLRIDNDRAAGQPFRLSVALWRRCCRNNPERQPLINNRQN